MQLAGAATLLISFREAAELGFQIATAVAVVICGTSIATIAAQSHLKPQQLIDVNRPVLWAAEPVRIDRQTQLLTITIHKPAVMDGQVANAVCSDAIGLRIACDLVAVDRNPS